MGLKCNGCGHCCSDPLLQINLSFGDIIRLARFSQKTVSQLFSEEIISFQPFIDPENGIGSIELGLAKPCRLLKENRCSVYRARPLNCRVFPFWLVGAPKSIISRMKREGFGCAKNEDGGDAQNEREYSRLIGDIILREAGLTDKLLNGLKGECGITDSNLFKKPSQGASENKPFRELQLRVLKALRGLEGNPSWVTLEDLDKLEGWVNG